MAPHVETKAMKKYLFVSLSAALLVASGLLSLSSQALAAEPAIGWIPTWDQALAEAKLTKKPILLIAAAPSCGGVPGVW